MGGAALFLILLGATYWIEARRGGNLRVIHDLAAVVLAFLLVQCGRLESQWCFIPAGILAAGAVIDHLRARRRADRGAQKETPTP